ncbi:ComEC/Rec2 family competence protein [Oceanobacillus picturae]|uniref:ComEC/Rec2 family competence protein n=1 Tax=Oceanobacillus picturae TaxID=171693 RepID=UPI000E6A1812|nr:MBL fold metallo-hydrolase [Oceanobacillus picturae]RIU88788.1 MBL fold metallo-hydrolase [Oceanobacillus picturae]
MCCHKRLITILLLFAYFILLSLPVSAEVKPGLLKVHFLDVGQGDSILMNTPSGKNILIDGGPPGSGKKIIAYLKEKQINRIDLLITTHPDIDHIGGLPQVLKKVKVKQVVDSGKLHTTRTYAKYIQQIIKHDIPVRLAEKNELLRIDPLLTIRILNTYGNSKNNNQSSIALKVTYDDIDLLLMSDVEMKQEKEFLKSYDVNAEIIKVAHHGSNTSSSLDFLKAVSPETAILTYSIENDYGHPVDRVIRNLYKVKSDIYSTAVFGDLEIRSDGKSYLVLPSRDPLSNIRKEAG